MRHPCIVLYIGLALEPAALVTEFCARGSVQGLLAAARGGGEPAQALSWPRRVQVALDAAKVGEDLMPWLVGTWLQGISFSQSSLVRGLAACKAAPSRLASCPRPPLHFTQGLMYLHGKRPPIVHRGEGPVQFGASYGVAVAHELHAVGA